MDVILGALSALHYIRTYKNKANLITASDPMYATAHAADPLHIYCAPFLFVPTTNNCNKHTTYIYISNLYALKSPFNISLNCIFSCVKV